MLRPAEQETRGTISLAGQPAVGIGASDAACFLAEPMQVDERDSFSRIPHRGKRGISQFAVARRFVRGLGAEQQAFNIDADRMAAAAAELVCRADRLIFLTERGRVLNGDKVLRAVKGTDVEDLIRQHKVSGGMILKLEAAKRALAGGVRWCGRRIVTLAGTRVFPTIRTRSKARTAHGAAMTSRRRNPAWTKRGSPAKVVRRQHALPDEHVPAPSGGVRARHRCRFVTIRGRAYLDFLAGVR